MSVIVPCRGREELLRQTIDSVLGQACPPGELIVVDDGSSPPLEAVHRAGPTPVRLVRQPHAGVAAARNHGVQVSSGELIHFLDADDGVAAGFHAALGEALDRNSDWGVAVAPTRFCFADGRPSTCSMAPPETGLLFERLACSNAFPPGAAMVRRSVLERVGGFDTALDITADWDLWLRVARLGASFGATSGPGLLYRVHPQGMSRDPMRSLAARLEVLARARRPDPRVADPDPRYADGADPGTFGRCATAATAACVGIALALGDTRSAVDLASKWAHGYAPGARPEPVDGQNLLFEASLVAGVIPPSRSAALRRCLRPLAATIAKLLRRRGGTRAALGLVRAFLT